MDSEIDLVSSKERACFRICDDDRKLPVPGFDVAGLQPPVKLHRILRFELGVVGIPVINAPDRVVFARLRSRRAAHLPAVQAHRVICDGIDYVFVGMLLSEALLGVHRWEIGVVGLAAGFLSYTCDTHDQGRGDRRGTIAFSRILLGTDRSRLPGVSL